MTIARNKLQDGDRLSHTNAGAAISKGDVVVAGSLVTVAETDIAASGGTGELMVGGVFSMPKTTGEAWTVGAALYWDASAAKFAIEAGATLATGDISGAGVAWAAAASGGTVGEVKLNPGIAKLTA